MATRRIPTAIGTDSSSWGWRIFSSPSNRANSEPRLKITRATTNDQKYRSRP